MSTILELPVVATKKKHPEVFILASSKAAQAYATFCLQNIGNPLNLREFAKASMGVARDEKFTLVRLHPENKTDSVNSCTEERVSMDANTLARVLSTNYDPANGFEVTQTIGGNKETHNYNRELLFETFPLDQFTTVRDTKAHYLATLKSAVAKILKPKDLSVGKEHSAEDQQLVTDFINKRIKEKTASSPEAYLTKPAYATEVRISIARDFNEVLVDECRKKSKPFKRFSYILGTLSGANLFTKFAPASIAGFGAAGFLYAKGEVVRQVYSEARSAVGHLSGKNRKTDFTAEKLHESVMHALKGYGIFGKENIENFLKKVENPPHTSKLRNSVKNIVGGVRTVRTFSL
jgi:hypothetical protein